MAFGMVDWCMGVSSSMGIRLCLQLSMISMDRWKIIQS